MFLTALLMVSLFGGAALDVAQAKNDVVKIGVLANRGPQKCLDEWSPTAEYLSRVIQGKTFMIVPVDFEQIYSVVEKGEVDFILAGSSFYVAMETWYSVSPVATLINKVLNKAQTQYGAVVFTKKNRDDIHQYSDLKGKTFMGVHENSLGGWLMAWREFKEAGVDPLKDFAALSFGGTHDAVVYAVRDGQVDAGTVRTGTLELMQADGTINISDFKVIHEHSGGKVHLPFMHSTRSYPERLLAKLEHTPLELAEKVAAALLAMPAESPAVKASESAGWTIPLNYQSVHECLKELKVGPYKDFGKVTPLAVLKKYWVMILIAFATLIVLILFLTKYIKLNQILTAAHRGLQTEAAERRQSEERVRQLNAVLQALRKVNKLMVTEKDCKRLIQQACDIIVASREYHNAWIALFDETGNFVSLVGAGMGEEFSQLSEILKDGSQVACSRKALEQPEIVVIGNPVEACMECHLANDYAGREAMSIRLEHNGKVYGTMTVSVPAGMATDSEEQSLFEEVARDISYALHALESGAQKKKSEDALRKSEEKYHALFNEARDGIVLTDPETGLIEDCNPQFVELTGRTLIDLKQLKIWEIRPPEKIEKAKEIFQAVKEMGYGGSDELEFQKPDGTIVPIEFIARRVTILNRQLIQSMVHDITERKQAEKEKIKLEEQLRQSQKMEAIGTLAGGVAHDFNNLLTSILGYAEISLMKLGKDDPLKEDIKEIIRAGTSAATLTRQLLAFSRRQILRPEVLNLNTVASNMDKILRRVIGEDVELETILKPDLGEVTADPGQIEQVLMNLAVNARDAMPQGGKLTIETANVDLDATYFENHGVVAVPGTYVMLAVTDTGCGMNKETQAQIFEPFFTTKEKGKGTGLGLSTVYGIVKQSNGFIWVYSEPGRGTTFKVCLPRLEGDAEVLKNEKIPVGVLTGSETILVVEDDDALKRLIQKILRSNGYSVLEAENGEEALRISNEHEGPIHLMITDVVMPKMGGREIAQRLQPLRSQMKVLYMSGYTDNAIAQHGVLASGLNFIEKPFTTKGFARKVREVLDKKQE